jgi:hypothetical protein
VAGNTGNLKCRIFVMMIWFPSCKKKQFLSTIGIPKSTDFVSQHQVKEFHAKYFIFSVLTSCLHLLCVGVRLLLLPVVYSTNKDDRIYSGSILLSTFMRSSCLKSNYDWPTNPEYWMYQLFLLDVSFLKRTKRLGLIELLKNCMLV